jgi:hypothetical protein
MSRSLASAVLLAVLAAWSCGSKPRVGDPSSASRPTANSVTTDQEFDLGPGQSVLVGTEPLKITFDAITADSRCAPEVQCVWEGDAVAKVQAATGTQAPSVYELHTNTGFATQVDHGGYRIRLTAVAPGPHLNVVIDPAAYVITLIVTRP